MTSELDEAAALRKRIEQLEAEVAELRASIRGLPLTQELHPFREIKEDIRSTGNYSEMKTSKFGVMPNDG